MNRLREGLKEVQSFLPTSIEGWLVAAAIAAVAISTQFAICHYGGQFVQGFLHELSPRIGINLTEPGADSRRFHDMRIAAEMEQQKAIREMFLRKQTPNDTKP